jgi:hypothetical protein
VTLTLEQAVARLEADRFSHMLGKPCERADLEWLEGKLGRPLPSGFRLLLERLGGGILYEKHEVFGPRRLLVHDIEMVPDLLSVRGTVGRSLPSYVLPFHRSAGAVSLLDLRAGRGGVLPGAHGPQTLDLAAFLEKVVLASRPAASARP